MDSNSIRCCLSLICKNPLVKKTYVIASDEIYLIDLESLPAAVIINTDPSSLPGRHWLGLYLFKQLNFVNAIYFDSYNKSLDYYNIRLPFRIVESSNRSLQSDKSSLCGIWSLAFLYNICRNRNLRKFENKFSHRLDLNDELIRKFYAKITQVNKTSAPRSVQSCCAKYLNLL
jgi:hypothetical protein